MPVRPLSISHQGQFPAITISFNLAQGVALGQATDAIQQAMLDLGAPATLNSSFQGTAQAFQQSLGTVPLLIVAALVVVYLILGILYESYIHPLTILSTLPSAGVGALAILMLFGFDFSLIALIGIILLIGIVKKNGIMMVDFAIAAERDEHLSPRRVDPQGRAAALPADHDDHDGGDARRRAADARHRHRLGNPPAARLRHGRRPDRQPGADAVHDAGGLSLSRQSLERACHAGAGAANPGPRLARNISCKNMLQNKSAARLFIGIGGTSVRFPGLHVQGELRQRHSARGDAHARDRATGRKLKSRSEHG